MGCERLNGCGDRREFNCPNNRRVINHRHIVNHRHDEIHEYDIIHQHDHHIFDVVRVREEHRHHDHRRHRPDYCRNNDNCEIVNNGGTVEDRGDSEGFENNCQ
ncbi:MAG: hypothetical protein FWE74_05130 [Oscillospiraceae bacterium]|nr:hypothetical protein [Oscillospiraceae bacterium]